jgi:radical SAM superfamily enzyme YgiQ (UPF0313 family)
MRLLLVWPTSPLDRFRGGDIGAISEPLALEYLAAGAKLDGHDARILDMRLHPKELDRTIQEFRPDIVGVTGYSMHVPYMIQVCHRAKLLAPACRTLVGGHHASFLPEDFFVPSVDFAVVGEGVGPLRALMQAIENDHSVDAIPGLWFRTGDKHLGGRPQEDFDIDRLPVPDRSLTAADRGYYFIDWMRPVALLRTTVGCPYRCSFCSLWKFMDRRYHMRNVDDVIEELELIDEAYVFLVDDEAFINGKRMLALASRIKENKIKKKYFAYCRIDTLIRNRNVLAAWREIGLERLFIGIEAITAVELVDYNKGYRPDQVQTAIAIAREFGIELFSQFIVRPTWGNEEFTNLVKFIKYHNLRYPSFTVLTPLPGTEFLTNFDNVTEKLANGRPNWKLFDCQHAVTETKLGRDAFQERYQKLLQFFGANYLRYRRSGGPLNVSHFV